MEFLDGTAKDLLKVLRTSGKLNLSDHSLSTDMKSYLLVEQAIREGRYSDVDQLAATAESQKVRLIGESYRDLFTNTSRAIKSIEALLLQLDPKETILFRRLRFWKAHINALFGELDESIRLYAELESEEPETDFWQVEELCLIALFKFLSGDTESARKIHYEADTKLKVTPDLFISVFNSAMALRTAIKIPDALMFDHFISQLEFYAGEFEFKRYRLRQLGYRAIILAQSGDFAYASAYWTLADHHLLNNESPFEAGQYLILRGLGSLLSDEGLHQEFFDRARVELQKASSGGPYLLDLELAEIFAPIAHPMKRGRNLLESVRLVEKACSLLRELEKSSTPSQVRYLKEGIDYCDHLLNSASDTRFKARFSLAINILENSSSLTSFDSSVSHYRVIPSFVRSISNGNLSEEAILDSVTKCLKQRTFHDEDTGKIRLESEAMNEIPDVKVLVGLAETLLRMKKDLEETTRISSQVHLARQVSHDIRSPLSALDTFFMNLPQVPEEQRMMARSAIARITDIANNLLHNKTEGEENSSQDGIEHNPGSVVLLSSLVDELLSEKRSQYRHLLNVGIYFERSQDSYGLFAEINSGMMKRVLSNLINNSVEAFPERIGDIKVELRERDDSVIVEVSDNGIGITESVLEKLGKKAISVGKEGRESGSGLGLSHAFPTIESFGGKIVISSTLGKGTSVRIILPRISAPKWFVEKIIIEENFRIVIVDDDASIHQIWQGRINSLIPEKYKLEVLHFSSPEDLKVWYQASSKNIDLFLVDYEFVGSKTNGIKLISDLEIAKKSVLVTGRYEEKKVVTESEELKLRIIPKGLAGYVPLEFELKSNPTIVLIDDDKLTHLNWKIYFKGKPVRFVSYFSIDTFLLDSKSIPLDARIYIDSSLGNYVRGEIDSVKIFNLGYTNLFLATGYEKDSVLKPVWIKDVFSKSPDCWEKF